jgi:hypothetical protein
MYDNSLTSNKYMEHKPGEVYVSKSIRGTFGEETYGVYIEGDDTLEGNTRTLGLFPSNHLAIQFFEFIKDQPLVEEQREEMFRHPEERISIDPNISISVEEWEQKFPELVKYHSK